MKNITSTQNRPVKNNETEELTFWHRDYSLEPTLSADALQFQPVLCAHLQKLLPQLNPETQNQRHQLVLDLTQRQLTYLHRFAFPQVRESYPNLFRPDCADLSKAVAHFKPSQTPPPQPVPPLPTAQTHPSSLIPRPSPEIPTTSAPDPNPLRTTSAPEPHQIPTKSASIRTTELSPKDPNSLETNDLRDPNDLPGADPRAPIDNLPPGEQARIYELICKRGIHTSIKLIPVCLTEKHVFSYDVLRRFKHRYEKRLLQNSIQLLRESSHREFAQLNEDTPVLQLAAASIKQRIVQQALSPDLSHNDAMSLVRQIAQLSAIDRAAQKFAPAANS